MSPKASKARKSPAKQKGSTATINKRKARFGFTIEKDLVLLRAAVSVNPWQLGEDKWLEVCEEIGKKYGCNITPRTVKIRVDLLIKKKETEELKSRTGTEEQATERGELLETIISFQKEAEAAINTVIGADDELSLLSEDSNADISSPPASPTKEHVASKVSTIKAERKEADAERNSALEKFKTDLADQPNSFRAKRRKNKEEELIFIKQEHDIEMEKKRLELEQEKNKVKSELEKMRLELEAARESRLSQESEKGHETAMAQLQMQKMMCEMFSAVIQKLGQ